VDTRPIHWFVIECGDSQLSVHRWSSEAAEAGGARHFCGEAHAEVYVSRWFDSVCSPPKPDFNLPSAFTFYAVAYLALFAIPFLSRKDRRLRPRFWLRLTAVSGFLMTLLYVVLSISPIVDVESSWGYSLKICTVVLGANFLGWAIYRAGRRNGRRVIG
jgi:ABC-type transport system involved in cytochrome c biogenesis permease subunit